LSGKRLQWDSELAGAGRLLLKNEDNFSTLQHVFLDPILDTLLENLQSKEEAIIEKISKKMEAIVKKKWRQYLHSAQCASMATRTFRTHAGSQDRSLSN